MDLFPNYRGNLRFWLKGYLFLGVALMILAMLIYSNHLITRMRDNSETTSRLFSRYFADHIFEVTEDGRLANLKLVMRESDLPIIITVLGGRPILWNNVSVEERTDKDLDSLVDLDINNPPTEKLSRLIELYRGFDKVNDPIPIRVSGSSVHSYVHYGPSPLQRELRMMPFVQLAIFLVFMGVAIQGLRYLKLSEERSIWVGMAKETAHQLGTPLSAMLGWVHLIKETARDKNYVDIESSLAEMEVDLGRLNKITDRFSKIGSQPELQSVDLKETIERTADYFEKRLPRERATTSISVSIADIPAVKANVELLEWVFENLIKNGLDALGEHGGKISIDAKRSMNSRFVDVYVRDTGKGIPAGLRDRIFRPGFTTKKRGWGLGLALTKRIVADYHRGSIRVVESRPGKGTTFRVRLPVA